MGLRKLNEANNDFQLVLRIDPENKDARDGVKKIHEVRPHTTPLSYHLPTVISTITRIDRDG